MTQNTVRVSGYPRVCSEGSLDVLQLRGNSGIVLLGAFIIQPKYVHSPGRIVDETQAARTRGCCLSRSCHYPLVLPLWYGSRTSGSKLVFELNQGPSSQISAHPLACKTGIQRNPAVLQDCDVNEGSQNTSAVRHACR